MANTIKIKRAASVSSTAPSLAEGELAYNEYNKELFIGTSGSNLQTIGGKIGDTVQAYDAGLEAIAGLTTAANKMVYTTGSDVYATTALTSTARTLLDDTSVSAMRSTLGVDSAGTSNYVLTTATASALGGIKVGANLTITAGVLAAASSYVLPTATTTVLGGIKVGTDLGMNGGVMNVLSSSSAEASGYLLPKKDSSHRISAMGFRVGRHTNTNTTAFGIEAYDHYGTTFRKLQWTPDSTVSGGGGDWKLEDTDDVMRIIAHEGNKADFQRAINATLTSTSDTISLAASQGKILQANIKDAEDKANAVGALFQNKLDIIQDTNFDWDAATTDIKDEMVAIYVGNSVATSQQLRDHLNQTVSGYARGDIDGDGDIDISDAVEFLKYIINNPEETFSWNIVNLIVQPMYDAPSTWSTYHSEGYLKTNASLPAAQVTESATKRLITDTERTDWAAASDWHVLQTGADGNSIIDTVAEIVSAFQSHAEGLNLITELDAKLTDSSTLDGGTY